MKKYMQKYAKNMQKYAEICRNMDFPAYKCGISHKIPKYAFFLHIMHIETGPTRMRVGPFSICTICKNMHFETEKCKFERGSPYKYR